MLWLAMRGRVYSLRLGKLLVGVAVNRTANCGGADALALFQNRAAFEAFPDSEFVSLVSKSRPGAPIILWNVIC